MNNSVVIDMSNFVQLSVDPTTFVATIGPGNRLGDVALGLSNAGRALPHGTCPFVGVGGHSGRQNYSNILFFLFILFFLHEGYGGYGFTSRKWGLLLDTIISLEVVLANGTIANISQTNYPDLFFVSI
jgi:FAD/FMN-containing dehydrogenase